MKLFSPMETMSAACSYVATQRGGVALLFEGHRYNKVRDGKDGTVYWRCSRDRQCPGRAVTVHNRVKKSNNKHNHPPEASLLLRNGNGSGSSNNHHSNNNNNSAANNNNSSASSAMAAAAAAAAAYASFLQGGNNSSSGSPHHQPHNSHTKSIGSHHHQHSPLLSGSRVHGSPASNTTTTTGSSPSPSPLSAHLSSLGLGPLTSVPNAFSFSGGSDHHQPNHHQQQHHNHHQHLHRQPHHHNALTAASLSSSSSTSHAQHRSHKSGRGFLKASPPGSPLQIPPSLPAPPLSSPSSSGQLQIDQQQTNLAAAFMLQDALQEAQAAAVAACAFPSLLTETFKYLAAAAATNPQMAAALAANLTTANPALMKSLHLAAAVVGAGGGGGAGGAGSDVNINNNGFGTSLRILPDLENPLQQQHLNLIHQHPFSTFESDADCQPLNMALNDLRGGAGCSILKMLRSVMRSGGAAATGTHGNHPPPAITDAFQALVVPTADAHGSEYIAPCDARREYISKFTGSAGTAVVTLKEAALWTDGRYFLQAAQQMDPSSWVLMKDRLPGTATIGEWLNQVLATEGGGARVGADPYTMSYEGWQRLEKELADGGNLLVGTPVNLVDAIWGDRRPARPAEPVLPLDISFTGRRWQEKVEEMRGEMTKKGAALLVLTALDDVAWLLNLRGADIEYNPVFFAYAIVTLEKTLLFIDESKLTATALAHLQQPTDDPMDSLSSSNSNSSNSNRSTPNGKSPSAACEMVEIRPYELVADYIRSYIAQSSSGRVWISNKSSYALVNLIPESRRLLTGVSPVTSRKAIKNAVEIAGMRRAHIKDAVALCEFYAWLEDEVLHHGKGARKLSSGDNAVIAHSPSSNSSSSSMSSSAQRGVDELAVDAKLEEFRRQQDDYIGPSFATISGSGPNGAVIHYSSTPETNRPITTEEMFLLDTGAQFRDGTTDITRTIHLGTPTAHERECFTRVLKGHISLATARFPRLVKGEFLDSFARRALWDVGLDYNHGTGHGVGSYLNVHEGPSGISNRVNADDPGVEEAMIYSNEPGYYEAGHFGIRLESLVLTKRVDLKYNFNDRGYLGFETITLVPIQTKLIDPSLMTAQEIEWIDSYHQQCRDLVGKELELQGRSRALQWLLKETQPIGQ